MNLANCPRCGKVFTKMSEPICSECIKLENKQYELVRGYLEKKKDAAMVEIVEATGVPEKTVFRFLREGRLEAEGQIEGLNCERCGAPVASGRYCAKCHKQVQMSIFGTIADHKENIQNALPPKSVMHTFKNK